MTTQMFIPIPGVYYWDLMKGRILFLVEGSEERGHSPAARFRVHQLVPYYEAAGWRCDVAWSFPKKYFAAAPFFRKIRNRPVLFNPISAAAVAVMAAHRLVQILTRAPFADIVFLQRNLLPTRWFPFLELLASKLAGKTIFDFDDAIFTDNRAPGRRYMDIPRILGFTDAVVCGNGYLAEYARGYNSNVTVIPTVPPLSTARRGPRTEGPVVIGWIGTAPNIPYLRTVEGALLRLAGRFRMTLLTVSDEPLRMPAGIPHEHRTWSIEEERRFFDTIDIGIMPLSDDEWTRGKCAFKAIEYMANGIPAVVSPVGANRDLGPEGNGVLFAFSEEEWEENISHLCGSLEFRNECGLRGKSAAARFSSERAAAAYLTVFGQRMRDNRAECETRGEG
jgi:glycosyltransferase involved in cell wall biosynthesis